MIGPVVDPRRVPSLDSIEDRVRAGLPGESERFEAAAENDRFCQAQREDVSHLRREAEDDASFAVRPKRLSYLTRTVIRKLAVSLYRPGPTRKLEKSPDLDAWLGEVYTDVHINSRMQSADRAATLNHACALQVEATGDPRRPVRLWLWKAHEFAAFFPPDDGLNPWAICTREVVQEPDGRRWRCRYRLWSAAERRTFITEPADSDRAARTMRAETLLADESGPSPYPGVLPFAFIRNEPPESRFWEGGIGSALRECNKHLDRGLSDIAEHVAWFLNPRGFARNVSLGTRFTERVGGFVLLRPDAGTREGDRGGQPEVFYLQAQLGVDAAWYDLRCYAEEVLEGLEVPITLVRMDASTDLSGVAIFLKQEPMRERTRARQPEFAEYETDLAARMLAVTGSWYRGWPLGQAALAAAADPKLTVTWPEVALPVATPERDAEDRAALDMGIASRTTIVMRRDGLTREQARARLADIALDLAAEAELFGAGAPVATSGEPETGMGEPTAAPEGDMTAMAADGQTNGRVVAGA